MGLDMYLKAEKYVSGYEHNEDKRKGEYRDLVARLDMGEFVDPDTPSGTISLTVAYWRKANQIHSWFVREVQDGVDDCKPYYVDREKLVELRDLCEELLKHRRTSEVEEKLPPQEGFFFGGTEIDEWYWQDLDYTVTQLDRVLKIPESNDLGYWKFYYQSSW